MVKIKQMKRARRQKRRMQRHKRSVLIISGIMVMLTAVVMINMMGLQAKNKQYKAQEAELENEIAKEEQRTEEIKDLEKYVGTDEYIEDTAKDKLGLAYPNEIIFKPQN